MANPFALSIVGGVLLFVPASTFADNGVPTPDHVVIVIEENHAYSEVIGTASAPYINSLASGGALMTASYAITHPSQPNYLAFYSGSTQGVTTDSVYPHSLFTAPNLAAKLLSAGLTFGGYSETMPSVGYDGASFGTAPATYQRKHNPWVNWQDSTLPLPANKVPPSVNMPYTGYFPPSANYVLLPRLSFVIPNQLNDMHDGTVAQGNAWLQSNLAAYALWCQTHNSLLIVTWDEDDSSAGNRVATIFYGPMVQPGQYAETVNHYRVLRTLEDMFGLGHDAGTVGLAPITDIWMPPATPGVCCRGAMCIAGIPQAACTSPTAYAGAAFISTSTLCNVAGTSSTPCCYADYNKVGGVGVQDIFDFLTDWFAGSPFAHLGGDGTSAPTVQDIFDFLAAWFAGCP